MEFRIALYHYNFVRKYDLALQISSYERNIFSVRQGTENGDYHN
jgi:hypothetical protein